MSTVRNNLMTEKGYTPYCGTDSIHCAIPRTHFNGKQFFCKHCGWVSQFPKEFINEYKIKWGLK